VAVFSYRSTTRDGVVADGVIEAPDEKAAVEQLRSSGLIPLEVKVPREEWRLPVRLRSGQGDLLSFTSELSALLGAGLPLDRGLGILSEISESKEMREVTQSILKSIREGSSFSDALQRHPGVFPRLYVNLIRAGEAGGVLDVVLDKLNEYLESTKELRDQVVSAMIYPAILTVTGAVSIAILLAYVLPKFSVIFAELGSSLPVPTKVLLAVSGGLQAYGWLLLLLAAAGGIAFRGYLRTEQGRYRWDAIKLRLMDDLVRKLETARFCRTLGTLLRSGVPLLQALENARDVIGNRVISAAIRDVSRGAKEGKGIAAPLADAKVFPSLALSMIKVGEETGRLDEMLLKVAGSYEKSLKQAVKRCISLLEPVLILVMGVLIGFIVVSMLMAVFSITEVPF
jgi:general secretion pathway protein F